MESVKLSACPEIAELFAVLEQNGLHREKDKVKSLVDYIEDMETRLWGMTTELSEIRQAVGQIHDSTLRAKCGRLYTKAEEKLKQAKTVVVTVKNNLMQSTGHAVKAFRDKGRDALMQAVTAMRIPAALEHLKSGMHRSAEAMRDSASRIDAMREELHEVGQHLKNAGCTLFGKPARKAEKLDADKGALAMLRRFMEGAGSKFADMEQGADKLISKIQGRESVKSELQVLTSERRKAAKAPTVHEQAR